MKKTPIFMLIILVTVIVFDFFIIIKEGKTESISAYIIRYFKEYPSLSLATGFLLGHLGWRMPDRDVYGEDNDIH